MSRCKKCLLPNTYPYISFDERGICNYCKSYSPRKYKGIDAFCELVNKIKLEQNRYDCLIGLSGGRDSSYLAYKLVKEFDLNVLAYSYNNGSMTETARENVKKITEKLDIKTIIIDKEADKNSKIFRRIFLAWAKKPSVGMIQMLCVGCRKNILKYSHSLMKKYNINYLADGGNFYEETYHKLGFLGIKKTSDELLNPKLQSLATGDGTIPSESSRTKIFLLTHAILKELFKNPCLLNPLIPIEGIKEFRMVFRGYAPGKSVFEPLKYEKFNVDKVIKTITNEFDWKYPSYYASTWRSDCKVAILKAYCLFKMLGFSDYDVVLSNMIRERLIDRISAMDKIEKHNNFDETFINAFLKSKGILHPQSYLRKISYYGSIH